MAADWNTIERKANGKLIENTGTECERELFSFPLNCVSAGFGE
jgi:hypothetical protein